MKFGKGGSQGIVSGHFYSFSSAKVLMNFCDFSYYILTYSFAKRYELKSKPYIMIKKSGSRYILLFYKEALAKLT